MTLASRPERLGFRLDGLIGWQGSLFGRDLLLHVFSVALWSPVVADQRGPHHSPGVLCALPGRHVMVFGLGSSLSWRHWVLQ